MYRIKKRLLNLKKYTIFVKNSSLIYWFYRRRLCHKYFHHHNFSLLHFRVTKLFVFVLYVSHVTQAHPRTHTYTHSQSSILWKSRQEKKKIGYFLLLFPSFFSGCLVTVIVHLSFIMRVRLNPSWGYESNRQFYYRQGHS